MTLIQFLASLYLGWGIGTAGAVWMRATDGRTDPGRIWPQRTGWNTADAMAVSVVAWPVIWGWVIRERWRRARRRRELNGP